MSFTKKISVNYYNIEAAEDDYFSKFYDNMETIIAADNTSSSFEAGNLKYLWKVIERIDTDNSASYLFAIAKEKQVYPMVFTEEGALNELALADGLLGDVFYGVVNPAYKFLLCFGGGSTGFKKMLGQFSAEGVVRLVPVFEEMVDEKVLNWDSYKRVSVSMNLPSGEDVTDFANSKAGSLMKLVEFLGGLKVDITVSAGGGKELLSNMMVKDLLPELIGNELCTSLTVRGSDFENGVPEQFDLKNAPIKYSEHVEVEGNYINETDAKQILMRALNERASYLFKN
ncbi:MAG: hypothetical protein LBV09_08195 [Deferribacteraceae bacterium]|jgi:hypothetical protein|nr:hypothetical protein [Deferribacteraceae bacterium]